MNSFACSEGVGQRAVGPCPFPKTRLLYLRYVILIAILIALLIFLRMTQSRHLEPCSHLMSRCLSPVFFRASVPFLVSFFEYLLKFSSICIVRNFKLVFVIGHHRVAQSRSLSMVCSYSLEICGNYSSPYTLMGGQKIMEHTWQGKMTALFATLRFVYALHIYQIRSRRPGRY